jgi:hypothetical protein
MNGVGETIGTYVFEGLDDVFGVRSAGEQTVVFVEKVYRGEGKV